MLCLHKVVFVVDNSQGLSGSGILC